MRSSKQLSRGTPLFHFWTVPPVRRFTALRFAIVLAALGFGPALAECESPAVVDLPVELIPQERDNWCWAAAAQMIMNAVGTESVPQCAQVAATFGRDQCCGDPTNCDQPGWPEFWKFGYSAVVVPEGAYLDWGQIQDQLAGKGKPFIWVYRYPHKCRAHMVVVTGYRTTSDGGRALKCYDPAPTGTGACWYISYEAYTNGFAGIHWRHYLDITKVGPDAPPIPRPECDERRDAGLPAAGAAAGKASVEPVFDCRRFGAEPQASERPELIGVARQSIWTGGERKMERKESTTIRSALK